MKFLLKWLIAALAIIIAAYLLPGIHVAGFFAALIVALVLGIINTFIRPVLVILTLPVTIVTLGFFMLVINALLVMLTGSIVKGFQVDGFWWALLFSLILSVVNSVLQKSLDKNQQF